MSCRELVDTSINSTGGKWTVIGDPLATVHSTVKFTYTSIDRCLDEYLRQSMLSAHAMELQQQSTSRLQ